MTVDIFALGATCGAILSVIGLITFVVKPVRRFFSDFRDEQLRNQLQDRQIADSLEHQRVMLVTLFAVLDGLQQIGCNHNVTTQYKALKDFINGRRFDTRWFKEE